ncbi:AMP-binding protein, partial [Nocardia sp. R7R-8]|uniref:AMP-binding protein n=1 Tax=Nocardia sp. R7R-8 TaxID=3459304 RepID=UPI00403D8AB5
RWLSRQFDLSAADIVLHKTPLTFDVSVWELFAAMVSGCRVILAEPGSERDPSRLAEIIRSERVTVVHFVPSILDPFLDGSTALDSLRQILVGGEFLSAAVAQRVVRGLGVRLLNLYGPTEATVTA